MDADTHNVESKHDNPDYSGSKIESTQSEVLRIEDVQKEKHATNNIYGNGSDEGDNALDSVSSLSGSLLTPPVKLVSAMKGSREKEGVAMKKRLTVNWAPDVYDPPPTDLEALLTKGTKQQKVPKKEKKAGKKQQKGKDFMQASISGKESSKAGGGKDKKKKQQRRGPGRLKNYNMFDDDAGPTLFSGSVEDDDSYNSKGWDSGKKKREKVGFVRNYDLPPSDDDSEDSDENTAAENHRKFSNGGKKDKQSHENTGKQRSYDLPPEEDDEEEEEEEASHGKSSSGGKKNMQSHGNLGKQRSYDLPLEEDEEEEEDSKFSSGGKKNKQNHGNLRQQRCYDLPPEEDEDEEEEEDEEEGVKKPNHGSSFLKHSLKEVHHSVAKAR